MKSSDINLNIAKQTIKLGIEGLQAVDKVIESSEFSKATKLICNQNKRGRLIISGIGKSGHISAKISASFSSTGTASYFIHPSEASHGDLGMITTDDLLLILSNSGETKELGDMIGYAKRFGIKIIAIVRRRKSALVNAADIAFILPEIPEASKVKAPTTSTMMMLALGDALVMSVLSQKNFTADEFKILHPGGKLGKIFTTVKDLMHSGKELPLIDIDKKMAETILVMTEKSFGCVGVTENNKLVGIITDGDLRRNMNNNLLDKKVREIMNKNPKTISQETLAQEALAIMDKNLITGLIVTDKNNHPSGIIHIHDLLRFGIA